MAALCYPSGLPANAASTARATGAPTARSEPSPAACSAAPVPNPAAIARGGSAAARTQHDNAVAAGGCACGAIAVLIEIVSLFLVIVLRGDVACVFLAGWRGSRRGLSSLAASPCFPRLRPTAGRG